MADEWLTLAPGVDIIRTSFRGRSLHLPVLRGDTLALVDTGMAETPGQSLLPYLAAHGLTPGDVGLVVITHAHTDHYAGNEAVRLAAGEGVRFAAHRLDRKWIEDPGGHTLRGLLPLLRLGLVTPEQAEQEVADSGKGVPVDRVLEGGEVLALGGGLDLEVIHLPGHTPGNLALLDRRDGILLQGESIIGTAQYGVDGRLLGCANHEDAAAYLSTIATVARLPFTTLVPSHLPLLDRSGAVTFLGDSLSYVLRVEDEVQTRLRAAGTATTVALWRPMGQLWGVYPHDLGLYALVEAHLRGLVARGLAQGSPTEGFTWVGGSDSLPALADEARRAIEAM